jgi:hypothetical protein
MLIIHNTHMPSCVSTGIFRTNSRQLLYLVLMNLLTVRIKRGIQWLNSFDRHIQRFLIGWKFASSLTAILNNKAVLFHFVDEATFPANSWHVRSMCANWSHALLAEMWTSGKCSPLWTTSWNAGCSKRNAHQGECMCIIKLQNCSMCCQLWFAHDCVRPFMFKYFFLMSRARSPLPYADLLLSQCARLVWIQFVP